MKKILLLILLLGATIAAGAAECLRIKPLTGEAVTFLFEDQPEVSFAGSKLQVKTASASPVSFEMDDIESIDFNQTTGASLADAAGISLRADALGFHLAGAPDGASAMVFDIAGHLLRSAECPAGEFHLLRSDFGRGVFIVKIEGFTAKVVL